MSREFELSLALGSNHQISAATVARIEQYIELALKWNSAINLVGRSTAAQMWERHIIDSAQIFKCATETQRVWLDLGSGGGYPGLPLALWHPQVPWALLDARRRKAEFLAAAGYGLNDWAAAKATAEDSRSTDDAKATAEDSRSTDDAKGTAEDSRSTIGLAGSREKRET